jgi:hypothetical protein
MFFKKRITILEDRIVALEKRLFIIENPYQFHVGQLVEYKQLNFYVAYRHVEFIEFAVDSLGERFEYNKWSNVYYLFRKWNEHNVDSELITRVCECDRFNLITTDSNSNVF